MLPLGKNIRKIRKKWRMDQSEFGKFMSVSKQMVSLYETGNNEPRIPFLLRICKLSNIDFVTLMEEEVLDKNIPNHPLENYNQEKLEIKSNQINKEKITHEDLVKLVLELKDQVEKLNKS